MLTSLVFFIFFLSQYKGEVRSLLLFTKGNGNANPITGEPLQYVPKPVAPVKNFHDPHANRGFGHH